MFNKKSQKKEDNGLAEKVNQDLIVHNMPDQKRILGNGFLAQSGVSSSFQVSAPKNNHKIVGAFILIGGFIVIGFLVYLSFNFIIKTGSKHNVFWWFLWTTIDSFSNSPFEAHKAKKENRVKDNKIHSGPLFIDRPA